MATPRTLLQRLRAIWPSALAVLANDGGANDGVGVEVTGTSDGKVNVSATGTVVATGPSGAALAKASQLPEAIGPTTPAGSVSVTGSIVTSQAALDDVTASGTATAFASLAAGPGGILVQNTSASGGANVRIDGAPTATHGVQLAPGEKWVFAVDNANRLKHYAESGSPTVSAAQA